MCLSQYCYWKRSIVSLQINGHYFSRYLTFLTRQSSMLELLYVTPYANKVCKCYKNVKILIQMKQMLRELLGYS